jgi:signal peptidase I
MLIHKSTGHTSGVLTALMLLWSNTTSAEIRLMTVEGDSMAPNLISGDQVILDTVAYISSAPQAGDLVAIRFSSRKRAMVKRIFAVENDTVEIIEGKLHRNNQDIGQSVLKRGKVSRILAGQLQQYENRLPARNYIVLGDNPNTSYDSRSYGFISVEQIIGKVSLADKVKLTTSNGDVQ